MKIRQLVLISLLCNFSCRSSSASNEQPVSQPDPIPEEKTQEKPDAPQGSLWIDPKSQAAADAQSLRLSQPEEARRLQYIADQPMAQWLGEWSRFQVNDSMSGQVLTLVLYNIPYRDCGSHSAGGSKPAEYRQWVESVVSALGSQPALVIVEPDALAQMDCLSRELQLERLKLIQDAVRILKKAPAARVYLDGGHPAWKPADVMVERLMQAGIKEADGFALNVSSYQTVEMNVAYGLTLRASLGKNFVIDTSRNGLGPDPKGEWCNPKDRALGAKPTLKTGLAFVDAFLWVKRPGESDGTCNGGPGAGQWWREIALDLARGAGI